MVKFGRRLSGSFKVNPALLERAAKRDKLSRGERAIYPTPKREERDENHKSTSRR